MSKRRLASVLYLIPIVLSDRAYAGGWLLQDGSYEIAFRLELPHLERWAVDKETEACVSEPNEQPRALPPILSDNNPFAGCAAKNVHQDESSLTFDIVCGGRDAARAKATYTLAPGGFHARISMTMGAKNMTMTEVQTGRHIGSCPLGVMLPD